MSQVQKPLGNAVFVVVTVLLAGLLLSVPLSDTGVAIRDSLFIRSFFQAPGRHLEYEPPGSSARDAFLRSRSTVRVEVPWAMTGYDLLDLYLLRNDSVAVATVRNAAGGRLGNMLVPGQTFEIYLN